ncbi:MAG: protein translocase subunit SecD [Candidatus Omnitrophota bacterium]
MQKNLKWKFVLVAVVIGISLWLFYPPKEKINLGLDLQGGMHLIIRADIDKLPEDSRADATNRVIETLRNRIDAFGVSEPLIQKQGKDKIVIQLPGVTERERALQVIKQTAHMEFRLVEDDEKKIQAAVKGNVPAGFELKYLDDKPLLVNKKAALTGDSLVNSQPEQSQGGIYPQVSFTLDAKGARQFARLTKENIGKRLAIVLDDVIRSAPVIRSEIPSGRGQIEGNFTWSEAADLALILRTGALPVPITIEEERTVGPNLGRDSIEKGIKAILIGGIAVIIFMTVYYLFAGLIADFALCTNIVIILGALAYFKATLTLPGIAGLILTIGMAVDANVLIFERMREEFRRGKPLRLAVVNGYSKAFSTILDANLTTLLTALILFKVGTGPIRGFAITLSIGIIASMFTALVVTRLIFDVLLLNKKFNKLTFLQFFKETHINFLNKRHIAYVLSAIVLIAGMVSFFHKGIANFGIDFTGGTLEQIRFEKPVELDTVRSLIKDAGIESAQLQGLGGEKKEILIKTDEESVAVIKETLDKNLADNKFEVLRVEHVGPTVGKELRSKAVWAVVFALLGMLVYISFRFEFIFAVGAIVALFHDALITIGILSLSGRQISLSVVAAVLTIVGYSINDTIVVFDRIREDARLAHAGKKDFQKIVNGAINETLSRTVLTSLTTLMVVLSLFIFGGLAIADFAFTLLIGIIVGTYSSIYVASPILVDWHYTYRAK